MRARAGKKTPHPNIVVHVLPATLGLTTEAIYLHVGLSRLDRVADICTIKDVRTVKNYPLRNHSRFSKLFSIFHGLGRALVFLCKAGVVHRDVKGDNVLLFRDGHPKLIDFASATIIWGAKTSTGTYAHWPGPPEASVDQSEDGYDNYFLVEEAVLTTDRTDLWALAYMIAHMLLYDGCKRNNLDVFRK